jgi:predicted RNA binding protein YcfA (HicA-like mRNA interferase family)
MPKLPRIPSILVLRTLKKIGFYEFYQSGSYIQLRHLKDKNKRITISFHRKDLSPKTLKSILKQASVSVEKFLNLM